MAADTYGFTQTFLKTAPDVAAKVRQGIAEGWEIDRFLDALKTTSWWKTRSDAAKRYDIELRENPAQIQAQVTAAANAIGRMGTMMGMAIPRLKQIQFARMQVRNGLSEAEVRYLVGSYYSHGGNAGLIGKSRAELTKLHADYGVKVSAGAMNSAIESILQGVRTTEDYRATAIAAAKNLYQGAAAQLDQGFTMRQILDPYLSVAADELGISASAMDISQGMWNAAATYRGEKPVSATPQRMMTMDEWTKTIRTDTRYGFDKSQNGQRAASVLATQLATRMGAF